ncbi:hypothetical protein Tco_1131902 [Tanacetum coccineum]|uniref:Retrotransposon gag domain-containing protein n=1 Tax=Tanacetum coccineum TaxID=301880 RepID=A0ABQ5JAE8_9ASTR
MAEFLRLPNFHGCKVSAGELLPPGSARVTHLTSPAERVEDIPPNTGDMMVAELPCRKVLDDKERNKIKAEEKADIHPTSEHVSPPTPLNHAEPLTTIAGEAHVTPSMFVGRIGVLRDQTDEPVTPPVANVGEFPTSREDGQDDADAMFANEGHGDNEGRLSGLQTQPSPARPADRPLETVEKPASDKIVPDAEAIPRFQDYIEMEMQIPRSSIVKFIATCSYSRLNDFKTSRKNDPKLPQTLISTSSSLETHLRDLYLNSSSHAVDAFKPVFRTFFGEEHQTFRLKMFHHLDQLRLQLKRETLLELQQHREFGLRYTVEANLNTEVKALDVGSVITESSGTKSDKHDTSSSSGTYITHAVDADIRPVNDQVSFAEVQLTAQHNVLANEQQHTEQSETIYEHILLEKVDRNTTHDSTNMCHREEKIDRS